jgi:hypothetical protein
MNYTCFNFWRNHLSIFHGYVHGEQGILGLGTTINYGINDESPSNKTKQ